MANTVSAATFDALLGLLVDRGELPPVYHTFTGDLVTLAHLCSTLRDKIAADGFLPTTHLEQILGVNQRTGEHVVETVVGESQGDLEIVQAFLLSRKGRDQLRASAVDFILQAEITAGDAVALALRVTTNLVYELLFSANPSDQVFRDKYESRVFYSASFRERLRNLLAEGLQTDRPISIAHILKGTECPPGLREELLHDILHPAASIHSPTAPIRGKLRGDIFTPDAYIAAQAAHLASQLSSIGVLPLSDIASMRPPPSGLHLATVFIASTHIDRLRDAVLAMTDAADPARPIANVVDMAALDVTGTVAAALGDAHDAAAFLQAMFPPQKRTTRGEDPVVVAGTVVARRARLVNACLAECDAALVAPLLKPTAVAAVTATGAVPTSREVSREAVAHRLLWVPADLRDAVVSDILPELRRRVDAARSLRMDPQRALLHWVSRFHVYCDGLDQLAGWGLPSSTVKTLGRHLLKTVGPNVAEALLAFVDDAQLTTIRDMMNQIIQSKSVAMFRKTIRTIAQHCKVDLPVTEEEDAELTAMLDEAKTNPLADPLVVELASQHGIMVLVDPAVHGEAIRRVLEKRQTASS
ncbi:hypothetical protein AMAG_05809 [Allomyces macrogynus ATCC 38327]|uniref:E3 UFM1-protein ligase 1-like N-terminal domain-containing protein n=1 Tax=Allomyces macrogynus (strain ATCC 38327) TaxID=578462 RepID=A0A0L0SDA9_ALLM3|nr:hypothetical protein AMAG_05809 [Allomyces macrogynus ATCC 38327]|eukprot:KNE60419.1 hypothetical protein AMAG_05809 [Allomyces macrogynus ATCC 38327]